ncbi:MAG: ABC transporter substrate-binding protein [Lachnospiraceae bacterium]|nr:ABC transporter substrate-binding protein [Lachnospiraceae bacterium]
MKKRMLSFVLAMTMIAALLTACGGSEEASAGSAAADAEVQTEASSDNAEAGTEAVDWDDIVDIHMCYMNMGPVPRGVKDVEAAINEITEEEIHTHVTIDVFEIGVYDQQVGLMLASNTPVDLMVTLPGGPAGFSSMRSQGQLKDITDLLDEYGQGILETTGDLIKATSLNGRIYAVPTYRNVASSFYLVMRTDVLEDLGLLEKAQNMTSFSEYEEIMEAVQNSDKWSHLAPLGSGSASLMVREGGACIGVDKFSDVGVFDYLGDNTRVVCTNPLAGDDKVMLSYDTDEYRDMIELGRRWWNKGLIYKDALISQFNGAAEMIKSDIAFSFLTDAEYGVESAYEVQCGMPMTCVKVYDYPITTASLVKFTWGVSSSAQEPEAAVAFMNMMYTDSRIANLLAWGIEGVDYEVTDGVAHFIEGNDNPAYHVSDYLFGNQFLVLPWDGNDADLRQVTEDLMKARPVSPYLGFMCDTSDISNEITAISSVIGEYRNRVELGVEDEEVCQEFVEKLRTAGADKIVATYQEQLDAWIAENR